MSREEYDAWAELVLEIMEIDLGEYE